MRRSKANWFGYILCRNCLLKHIIEGKIEGRIAVKGRRRRRSKQRLDDLNETRRYCILKQDAIHRHLWRACCGTACGPVVTETTGRWHE